MKTIINFLKAIWNKCGENTKLVLGLIPGGILFWGLIGVFGETTQRGLCITILIGCVLFILLWTVCIFSMVVDHIKKNLRK